jgi:hypothetical protein
MFKTYLTGKITLHVAQSVNTLYEEEEDADNNNNNNNNKEQHQHHQCCQ